MKQFWKRAAVAIVSLALLAGMPPAAGAASDEVEAALASMTLREKVGQLFGRAGRKRWILSSAPAA